MKNETVFIEESKFVLNLHLYDSELFEVVRVNYLMHNKVCVLTELNSSTKIAPELKNLFVCCSRETLASGVASLIETQKNSKNSGQRL